MGCIQSKNIGIQAKDQQPAQPPDLEEGNNGGGAGAGDHGEQKSEGKEEESNSNQQAGVPSFKEYALAELRAATNGFSRELIVSESGEKAPNVVYRGKLKNNRLVAIKRFSKQSWPDPQQFVAGVAPMICC